MLRPLILICCLLAGPAFAEDVELTIAQDRYAAGDEVRFDGPEVTDLFMGGDRVVVTAPVSGSAYLFGRRVTVDAAVAGDFFAAGYDVAVSEAVGGNANTAGYEVNLGPVAGNLRAAGAEVQVGAIGGYALINGKDVTLEGAIVGDAIVVADTIEFGPQARVGGTLTIYAGDQASITVPEAVAPSARVEVKSREHYDAQTWTEQVQPDVPLWRIVIGFLAGVLVSGLIAALVIFVAPGAVQNWRTLALAHPGRAIWSGFLVASALVGSGFVMTLRVSS